MNMNLLMQVLKSGKQEQLLLSMMNPQQRQIAEAFLAKPNREQALEELKRDYNVTDAQINSLKDAIK